MSTSRNYSFGHETPDDLFIIFKDKKVNVARVDWYGRRGTKSVKDEILTLKDGHKVNEAHFKYGLAKVIGDWFQWRLKITFDVKLMREMLKAPNPLLASIPKDDAWKGGYISIPFKGHDR